MAMAIGVGLVGVFGNLRYDRCQAQRESGERYFMYEEGIVSRVSH